MCACPAVKKKQQVIRVQVKASENADDATLSALVLRKVDFITLIWLKLIVECIKFNTDPTQDQSVLAGRFSLMYYSSESLMRIITHVQQDFIQTLDSFCHVCFWWRMCSDLETALMRNIIHGETSIAKASCMMNLQEFAMKTIVDVTAENIRFNLQFEWNWI